MSALTTRQATALRPQMNLLRITAVVLAAPFSLVLDRFTVS